MEYERLVDNNPDSDDEDTPSYGPYPKITNSKRSLTSPTTTTTSISSSSNYSIEPSGENFFFLVTLCLFAAIGGLLFGYDTGIISGALLLIVDDYSLDGEEWIQEAIVSGAVAGAILGALSGARANGAFGRRKVIIFSAVLFIGGALIMTFAPDWILLFLGRIVVGYAVGISSMTIPVYIAEVSPPELRGNLVSLNNLFITGGEFFAALIAGAFSNVNSGWRWMFGLSAIPAGLQLIGFLISLPESPRWLASKGRVDEAMQVLRRVRNKGKEKEIEEEMNEILESLKTEDSVIHKSNTTTTTTTSSSSMTTTSNKSSDRNGNDNRVIGSNNSSGGSSIGGRGNESSMEMMRELFGKESNRRAIILGIGIQTIQQAAGINTVMYYTATIVKMAGIIDTSTAIWISAGVASFNFIFSIVGVWLVERVGRRKLALWSLMGAMISLILLGMSLQYAVLTSDDVDSFGDCDSVETCDACISSSEGCGYCSSSGNETKGMCFPSGDDDDDEYEFGSDCPDGSDFTTCDNPLWWTPIIGLCTYLICFASGMGPVPWAIISEIFPLNVRSYGNSLSVAANWTTNLIISMTFLSLVKAITKYGAFYFYAFLCLLGWLFLYFKLPETKGKTLEEIQYLFSESAPPPWKMVETTSFRTISDPSATLLLRRELHNEQ